MLRNIINSNNNINLENLLNDSHLKITILICALYNNLIFHDNISYNTYANILYQISNI